MLFKYLLNNLFYERIKLLINNVNIENIESIENQNNLINKITDETLKNFLTTFLKETSAVKIIENLTVNYNNKTFVMEFVLVLPNNNGIYVNIVPNKNDYNDDNRKYFDQIKKSKYYFDNPFIKINFTDMMIITLDKEFIVSSKQRDFIQKNVFNFINQGSKVYFGEEFQYEGNKTFLKILKNNFFRFEKINNFFNKHFYVRKLNYKKINTEKLFKHSVNFNFLFENYYIDTMRKNNILFPESLLLEFKPNDFNIITYLVE